MSATDDTWIAPTGGGDFTVPAERVGGRYAILGLIGTGGMGSVYRAQDLELDEVVALKFLKREIADEPGVMERFRQEAKLARRVTHRNVARMFDIGEYEGRKFLTMELVDGEPLGRLLAREGALSVSRAVGITLQLCQGLAAAHAAGVVHRDLKPDNVLIEQTGRVVITDFGIARVAMVDSGQTQGPIGTPAYMAPEQVEGTADLDGRADIYALGALFYEMLTGQRAWSGGSAFVLAVRRLTDPPPDPRIKVPSLPDGIAEVVLRCLARKRDDRFATAAEVVVALSNARLPTPAPIVVHPTPAPIRAQRVAPAFEQGDRTVAVLPFRNAGHASDDELAEGLTDDLVDALSVTRGVRVRSRRSVQAHVTQDDLAAIGRALDVEVVVEGTLRRVGEKMRITARLQSCRDGLQLWASRFERAESELLVVNDEVAQAVANALTCDRIVPQRAASDGGAVDLYLRGKRALKRAWSGLGDLGEALALFEEGLQRAPDDAALLSGYAMTLARSLGHANSDVRAPEEVRVIADRAVALAPQQGEPWMALGTLHHITSDWPAAVRALRTALNRAPGMIEAHKLLASIQIEVGQPEEALFRLETVRALDPQIAELRSDLGRGNALLGRWDRAEAIVSAPAEGEAKIGRELIRARLALWRRTPVELEWPTHGPPAVALAQLVEATTRAGRMPPAALDLIDAAVDLAVPGARLQPLLLQVRTELCAFSGDRERALVSLERAADANLYDVLWLDGCPLLEGLRDAPVFREVRARVAGRCAPVLEALIEPLGE